MQEIVMAIRGISSAIDTAKRLSEAANASNNAGLVMAIADLRLQLADAKIQLSKAVNEIENLQKGLTMFPPRKKQTLVTDRLTHSDYVVENIHNVNLLFGLYCVCCRRDKC